MDFDKSKILTAVTADQAKVGDIGWFSDNISKMKRTVQEERPLILAHIGEEGKVARFYSERCNLGWYLFYPAPYEYFQAKWVKENRLQVGDVVKVLKGWKHDEQGFRKEFKKHYLDVIGRVVGINDDNINIQAEWTQAGRFNALVPYFAIEKVKEEPKGEYRPFANAEEFAPYRDRWFIDKHDSDIVRVELYCNSGITEVRGYCSYDELLNSYTFDDGTPAGVRV